MLLYPGDRTAVSVGLIQLKKYLVLILISGALLFLPDQARLEPSVLVPVEFKDLYVRLEHQLDLFDELLATRHPGQEYSVVFGAELLTANANRGPQLLSPQTYPGVLVELDRLKSMGVQAVTLSIGFPLLYPPFYEKPTEYRRYIDFYKQLAFDIRKRGMKIIVKSGIIFSKGGFSDARMNMPKFYRSLSFQEYQKGRLAVAMAVAREIKPDYLCIGSEPDTEAEQTGKPVNDLRNFTRMISLISAGIKEAAPEISIGAGMGSWQAGYKDFASALVKLSGLDFIDIHVYPVNLDFLERVLTIADIAKAHRKKVAMSEAWLYKSRVKDLLKGFVLPEMSGRDTFSFWEPLDQKFVKSMVALSRAKEFEFFSLFWSKYFYAYLEYEQVKGFDPHQLAALSAAESVKAMVSGELTTLGKTYSALLKNESY